MLIRFFESYWVSYSVCSWHLTFKLLFFFFKRADDIMSLVTDTTLLVHFFGKKGKAELNFEDFYR